jgi:hypothetical protein
MLKLKLKETVLFFSSLQIHPRPPPSTSLDEKQHKREMQLFINIKESRVPGVKQKFANKSSFLK